MPAIRNTASDGAVRIILEIPGPLTRAQIVQRARQAFGDAAVLIESAGLSETVKAPATADPFAALERLSKQVKKNSAGRPTTPDEIEALVHQVRVQRRAASSSE